MNTSYATNGSDYPGGMVSVVEGFIAGINDRRIQDVLNAFLSGAVVNDQLVEYEGHDAIAVWLRKDIFDQNARIVAVQHRVRPTGVVSTVEMTGDFDGLGLPEPLILSCYFSISNGSVDQLIILRKGL